MSKTHGASGVWNRGRSLDNMYEVNGKMLNDEEFKKFVSDIEQKKNRGLENSVIMKQQIAQKFKSMHSNKVTPEEIHKQQEDQNFQKWAS